MTMDMFGAKNAHLKGIHYLRNVEDADALVAYFAEAKKTSNKAIMVGGGYIGLEVSANLVGNGFDGTIPAYLGLSILILRLSVCDLSRKASMRAAIMGWDCYYAIHTKHCSTLPGCFWGQGL